MKTKTRTAANVEVAVKMAMIEMARGAQYVADQDPKLLKNGRKWQRGFEAGTRAAILAIARAIQDDAPSRALDYMANAMEANAERPRQSSARLVINATRIAQEVR